MYLLLLLVFKDKRLIPSTSIEPLLGFARPTIFFINVVLPQPLLPSNTNKSPLLI